MFWEHSWMPKEVQEIIFDYLLANSLLKASCVSKAWNGDIALLNQILDGSHT